MKITEALLAEHVVFHNLFDHIERTMPKLRTLAEAKSLAALLETLLEAHSRAEEELVIAPLEHCLEQLGQHEIFHQEHEEIDHNLKHVHVDASLAQARRHLLAAVVSSRRHFDKEERIIFPLAEKHLKKETLLALGGAWKQRRHLVS